MSGILSATLLVQVKRLKIVLVLIDTVLSSDKNSELSPHVFFCRELLQQPDRIAAIHKTDKGKKHTVAQHFLNVFTA